MFSPYSWNTKIYPLEIINNHKDKVRMNMREALIGETYYYAGHSHPAIPYGTILGVLTYKRFREPVIYDPTRFVGSYVCKFTHYSGEFYPDELVLPV